MAGEFRVRDGGQLERDPLSVRYDRTARRVLERAVEARQLGKGGAVTFVASPPGEFRELDRGGRTRHERAFTRSAYWHVRFADPRYYSLKLTWGPLENHAGRWGRRVAVRLFLYRSGYRHASASPSSYINDPSLKSEIGNRVR